jgi:glutamyl/glutaminyl-tRNA synthetase
VYQSHRFPIYRDAANFLISEGWAAERDGAIVFTLESRRKDGYIFPSTWKDEIKGEIKITDDDKANMEGMVLIKSDGSPAYNFCSVVDDMILEINYIIRGVDHITNTAKQVVLWEALRSHLEFPLPKFAHLGLICISGKPMSKRDGASSMLHYRNVGYDSDAMLNFLARLGWGPTVDDKSAVILDTNRMLDLFLTGGKMRNTSAGFDLSKLESFDRKYKARKGIWRTGGKLL